MAKNSKDFKNELLGVFEEKSKLKNEESQKDFKTELKNAFSQKTSKLSLEEEPIKNNTQVVNRSYKNASYNSDVIVPRVQSNTFTIKRINKYQFYVDDDLANILDAFMKKNHLKTSQAMKYILIDFFYSKK